MNAVTRPTLFISIAAYRDMDLAPTIADCLAKACYPERLRFGVCWQHHDDERLPGWLHGAPFRILHVPWRESRGACWARAEIMRLWDGEDWYLQLDSHHRFTVDWDRKLLEQADLTDSPKPVLTTYGASLVCNRASDLAEQVTRIDFDRFTGDGAILTVPAVIDGSTRPPMRARFISAHFLFAPGTFVEDIPYDPELYFTGEEITLAIRAFTHGYHLFHPSRHILWHEYTRAHRPRHWDDHRADRGIETEWHERDAVSRAKVKRFLVHPTVGRYELGSARSFAEYETYAGLSFRHRCVQDYTRSHREPPNPPADPTWPQRVREREVVIEVELDELEPAALEDPEVWCIGIRDSAGVEIHRSDADGAEILRVRTAGGGPLRLVRQFVSEAEPTSWTLVPRSRSKGWLRRVSRPINASPRIFVAIAAYRDPDLGQTIADCLAKAAHPDRLRFGVCWQRDRDEFLPGWLAGAQYRIIALDWRHSRGQCWARAEANRLWDGEEWYLQLDAHHRFAEHWDAMLIEQAAMTRAGKPLLSGPGPPFAPGQPLVAGEPCRMEFAGFRDNGFPGTKVGRLPPNGRTAGPVAARWICGHMLFAPSSFIDEVPYDPEMYFGVEDVTVAIRAFTHGYDLFHPAQVVVWHDYRLGRPKHWDDHTADHGVEQTWYELMQASFERAAELILEEPIGGCGLGMRRTIAEYEAYSGISFRGRRVQDYTLMGMDPPNPVADPGWPDRVRDRRIEIRLDAADLAVPGDLAFCYVGVHDDLGRELYRCDATASELNALREAGRDEITVVRQFQSEAAPKTWTVIPHNHSSGWGKRITGLVRPTGIGS
jgi:hypothetical protein